MSRRYASLLLAVALLLVAALGLGASGVLLWDYVGGSASAVCSVGGGCGEVKASAFASILGIPTPVFGVLFFASALVLWALGSRFEKTLWYLSVVGALAGAALLVLQKTVVGAFCQYCVLADCASLALCLLVGISRARGSFPRVRRIGAALASAAFAAVLLFGVLRLAVAPTPSDDERTTDLASLPEAIAREQREDLVTIVEFIDFECPGCRALHHSLSEAIADDRDRVRIARKHLPLSRHANALDAARAYCCAEERGRGEEMADRLFTAEDLRPEACSDIAASLGLDRERFRECVASARIEERLERDLDDARSIGVRSLPTFFIGHRRFEGARDVDTLRAAVTAMLAQ